MALDVAMGGSTNTILHLLAAAHEGGVDFGLKEIDELSRRVPCLCKVAPSSSYHVEDVHRAGGIHTILGELDRAGLLNRTVHTVHGQPIADWDLRSGAASDEAVELYHAAPGGVRTTKAYSQSARWASLDLDAGVRVHPRRGARVHRRRRARRAVRQPGAGRRDREDRRGPRGAVHVLRAGPGVRVAGGCRRRHPRRPGDGRRRRGDQVRGAARRARHAGDAVPDVVPEGEGARPGLRADHRRAVLRRDFRAVDRPHRPRGGQRAA